MKNCEVKQQYLIRTSAEKSDDYDKKFMKIKFNSVDDFSQYKTTEITTMTIVVTAVFHENKKYYPQVFLDEYLHEI